jgi:hypothetical protein
MLAEVINVEPEYTSTTPPFTIPPPVLVTLPESTVEARTFGGDEIINAVNPEIANNKIIRRRKVFINLLYFMDKLVTTKSFYF